MDAPTDDELVRRVLAGDREAFTPLVERYTGYIHGVAARFGQVDPAIDATDVAQEVFVRAYVRLPTYIPSGQFGAWLARIAANWCIDRQRRRRFVTTVPDLLAARPDRGPGPEEATLRREAGDALAGCLLALPEKERRALELCAVLALSHRAAGALLGVPQTTVKMRLYRGRERLRGLLAGD